VLEQFRPRGVFLTGGDTAISFMRALEASGSMIQTEILVGIPMMRLRGGPWDGLKIITKAGAFGREDAIDFALRKLKEVD
ncbi:MAG TPA: four-carbon acid sugar kinase family protein, partial [Clostridiales bacterium]|nr:four-carbon acid sugar kinase family protein [Clostridiales bacterium]